MNSPEEIGVYSLSDLVKKYKDNPPKWHDGNYRRGYMHGYVAALKHIKKYSLTAAADFLWDQIARWRCDEIKCLIPPPEMNEKTIGTKYKKMWE